MIFKYNPTKELETYFKRRFALFPIKLINGDILWLEWYYQKKQYVSEGYYEDQFPPRSWGSYSGSFWEIKNALTLNELENPILDNFYTKHPNKIPLEDYTWKI